MSSERDDVGDRSATSTRAKAKTFFARRLGGSEMQMEEIGAAGVEVGAVTDE